MVKYYFNILKIREKMAIQIANLYVYAKDLYDQAVEGFPDLRDSLWELFRENVLQTDQMEYKPLLGVFVDGKELEDRRPNDEWVRLVEQLKFIYKKTHDPEIQSQIRFDVVNFLSKAAYLGYNLGVYYGSDDLDRDSYYRDLYEKLVQVGSLNFIGNYHRTSKQFVPVNSLANYQKQIGFSPLEGDRIFVESDKIDYFFPLRFTPLRRDLSEERLIEIVVDNLKISDRRQMPFLMEKPFLINVTKEFTSVLCSDLAEDKPKAVEERRKEVEEHLSTIIGKVCQKLKLQLHLSDEEVEYLESHIRLNMTMYFQIDLEDGIKALEFIPLKRKNVSSQADSQFDDLAGKRSLHFQEWVDATAVRIGAVSLRKSRADNYSIKELTYNSESSDIIQASDRLDIGLNIESPRDILRLSSINNMRHIAETDSGEPFAREFFCTVTYQLIKQLCESISDEMWADKIKDSEFKDYLNLIVANVDRDLSKALLNIEDFRIFIESMDRVHAKLASLLNVFKPFDLDVFTKTFTLELEDRLLPEGLHVQSAGITRSAMNTFSGILVEIQKKNPSPVLAIVPHSYYENNYLIPSSSSLEVVLQNPEVEKVDLFVTEFYHNIDIDKDHTRYQRENVVEDIKRIFREKPKTDSLTVAIDGTIDYLYSEDIKDLFASLKDEIQAGKLNIIVYRSGQKFDMFGMDNYYGGNYYLVNNGDQKWDRFNSFLSEEQFQTDDLSKQFFAWNFAAGSELVDGYKRLIFDMTQSILSFVPETLKPEGNPYVSVAQFDPDVLTSFIDIKVSPELPSHVQTDLTSWIYSRFVELFLDQHRGVYGRRGSFGFTQANITPIEPKIRITPGIDAGERPLYLQFFKELEAKVKELALEA